MKNTVGQMWKEAVKETERMDWQRDNSNEWGQWLKKETTGGHIWLQSDTDKWMEMDLRERRRRMGGREGDGVLKTH